MKHCKHLYAPVRISWFRSVKGFAAALKNPGVFFVWKSKNNVGSNPIGGLEFNTSNAQIYVWWSLDANHPRKVSQPFLCIKGTRYSGFCPCSKVEWIDTKDEMFFFFFARHGWMACHGYLLNLHFFLMLGGGYVRNKSNWTIIFFKWVGSITTYVTP